MAHKKGAGSTKNGRDSNSKRLGVKCFQNHKVSKGSIIIRQRGLRVKAGENIGIGKDFTLYALEAGLVKFKKSRNKTIVSIENCNFLNVEV
ncbi:unnamed protein product [Heterosigma akashiwo]|jgi:large subunit ribosomal protein L27|uniref:50S ribosomal protein L2 n=2 Tax=Heterosigma akashiwo TaxID=2829 RepID=B2XTB2_HETAK|nr:ribosomal protein L27 [Heterosigma akashiwo]ABV66010.1 50S ribosomal protein L27 [Heterosigma akashiwo]ABV70151.1 50S ribosomal protein L27 [Heterosigma akashiwo]BBA18218.1 50S ribosomal protein L2 [Heterosigma akashiwo]BBA18357.1 50S ribosomal protein L2 [Heterosigma akashiwo]BBA18496.1 50S ribosomal protein L2 [Heterosigma akashiwo]|mmetsp:Transcript_32234/g.47140  ORF Transcript_32234/g.47140 Transcript_32234/m.47140 type:complete len:91 (+) Transcript_32234:898-1170(+)